MAHQLRFDDATITAEIVISAPNRNALDRAGILELRALLDEVLEHDQVRTVIITGAGDDFCAGRTRDMSLVTKEEIATDLNPIMELNARLESYPLPIIAAVEGVAFGFGFGLATLCDITIAGEGATFALTELAHGIPPLIVLSYFFKFVPYKVGLDLALTGRELAANEALQLGLVTSTCPDGGALTTARARATQIAAADAEAVGLLRRFARDQADLADPAAASHGAGQLAALLASKTN
jgi:enoyl-CoA hydratase/carnithine racemase